jgi:hypothetical protein
MNKLIIVMLVLLLALIWRLHDSPAVKPPVFGNTVILYRV